MAKPKKKASRKKRIPMQLIGDWQWADLSKPEFVRWDIVLGVGIYPVYRRVRWRWVGEVQEIEPHEYRGALLSVRHEDLRVRAAVASLLSNVYYLGPLLETALPEPSE